MTIFQRIQLAGGELVVYEAFIDFCPEHTVRHDVQQGMSVVGSLIKTLCIPGVRLGYVCAEPDVILKLEKRSLPWSLSTLASAVAADWDRIDRIMNQNGNVMVSFLLGLFDDVQLFAVIASHIRRQKGLEEETQAYVSFEEFRERKSDRIMDIMRASVDMDAVYQIIRGEV